MHGKSAVREQFVRPFIAGFPGNHHYVKSIICDREATIVEFTFKAEHKGAFAGHMATNVRVELPGCGVYELNSQERQITAARIYFDVDTLLKQIADQREPRLRMEEAVSPAGTIAPRGRMARYRYRDPNLASTLRRGSARKARRQAHACGDQVRRR